MGARSQVRVACAHGMRSAALTACIMGTGSVLTKAFVDIASPEQKSSEPAVWESIRSQFLSRCARATQSPVLTWQ